MKNIILQHWDGQLPSWGEICSESISNYSKKIGADYELLSGFPMEDFMKNLNSKPFLVIQKIFMLNEKYDDYDNVLMLDMDMLATKYVDNIFEYEGVGRLHKRGMASLEGSKTGRKWPLLYKKGSPIFFGNCVKFTLEERKALRSSLDKEIIVKGKSVDGLPPNDESIMHYLIHSSTALKNKKTLEVPHSKFCDLVEEAHPEATLLHFCGSRKDQIRKI